MNEPPIELRVILVGRTGLDARLRLDAGIELVRVRAPLDAIGELADPIGDAQRVRQVVILAGDAEPVNLSEWTGALRRVEPTVRVLRVGADRSGVGIAYDEAIAPDASVEHLHEIVRGSATTVSLSESHCVPPAQTSPDLPVPDQPAPADRASARAAAADEAIIMPDVAVPLADAPMVEAMIHGRDALEPAINLIRARAGDRAIDFDRAGVDRGVTVRWRGRVYGELVSDTIDPAELVPHAAWLAGWLRLDEQQRELRKAALTDPLTGAWNRRYFDRFLDAALERAMEHRRSVTLLVFDIDDFKRFNDEYGHAAGDEILVETVALMNSVIRPTDRVCRIGGDEFAVIFHEPQGPREPGSTPPESVFQISARFQKQITEQRFPKLGDDAPGELTISGGLATYPWDGRTASELLERADQLSLRSKKLGKNAITLGPGAERVRHDERGLA